MLDPVAFDVLARYPADSRPLAALEPLDNAGGQSGARLWRYSSRGGLLALRAWPADGPDRVAVRRIHGWLAELRDLKIVPVPLPDRQGRTILEAGGRLWQVEPWMPGTPDLSEPPAPARLRAGFEALGDVHERLAHLGDLGPSPGLEQRRRLLGWLLAGGFDAIESALAGASAGAEKDLALRWLSLARSVAPGIARELGQHGDRPVARQPCFRDVRPEHLLFTGDRLTGLVDPGAMGVESPAADLARLIGEWLGPCRANVSGALAAYVSHRPTGWPSPDLIDLFERSAAVLIGGRWARWYFLEGRPFVDPEAVRRGLERGVRRVAWLVESRV